MFRGICKGNCPLQAKPPRLPLKKIRFFNLNSLHKKERYLESIPKYSRNSNYGLWLLICSSDNKYWSSYLGILENSRITFTLDNYMSYKDQLINGLSKSELRNLSKD